MPKTPEEKKAALAWIISIAKKAGATVAITVSLTGAGMWYVIENYLDDYIDEKVHGIIDEQHGSQSFREILGEQMGVPTDLVPYHIVDRFDQLDSIVAEVTSFENKYVPHLDYQLRISPMYRFIDEDGVEWWMGPDRRAHGVLFDNGEAWCVYSNKKVVVGKSY